MLKKNLAVGSRVGSRLAVVIASCALATAFAVAGATSAASASTTGVSGTTFLQGIACESATTCFAVGTTGTEGVVVEIDGGTVGTVTDVSSTSDLLGVACATSDTCEAVGYAPAGGGSVVVEIDSGTPGTPVPAGGTELQGVACPTASSCEAVGFDTNSEGMVVSIALPLTTSSISSTDVSDTADLTGIACPTSTICEAVGGNSSAAGVVVPVISGTPGTPVADSAVEDIQALACPTASVCEGGTFSPSGVVPIALDGSGDPTPGSLETVSGTSELDGVACTSDTTCGAVGTNSDKSSGVFVPVPVGGTPGAAVDISGTEELFGIACPSAASCEAAGINSSFDEGVVITPSPVTLYVDGTNGAVTTGCTAAGAGACETIQEGVTAAEALGFSAVTVMIAADGTGLYDENDTISVPSGDTLTLQGAGATSTIADGGGNGSVFAIDSGATVNISGLTIEDGSAPIADAFSGGGIYNFGGTVTVTDSTISGNTAASGGGIVNDYYGTLTVTDSTISGNTATNGGGIYNLAGTVTVTDSTISGNTAYYGGGLFNNDTATVTDSTISGNTAVDNGDGIDNDGTLTVTDSTISGNTATYGSGGGIYNTQNVGAVTVGASIVANNAGGNCATTNAAGGVTDEGYNIDDDGSCGFSATGSISKSTKLDLGSLTDNGGPTDTILPGPMSLGDRGDPARHHPERGPGLPADRPAGGCEQWLLRHRGRGGPGHHYTAQLRLFERDVLDGEPGRVLRHDRRERRVRPVLHHGPKRPSDRPDGHPLGEHDLAYRHPDLSWHLRVRFGHRQRLHGRHGHR